MTDQTSMTPATSPIPALARLEPVGLRHGWPHEAGFFTPWLAETANLALLGDALGLRLEVEGIEVNVGPFRADLLCRDLDTDAQVLIENQLERTDHGHLGQILTYVAGLDAKTVIWIAAEFTEEHRAALDWLNDATDERYHFFGVVVELWRIGDSDPAPRFNLVAKPNDWSRSAARAARSVQTASLSAIGERRLAYWEGFRLALSSQDAPFTLTRATASANVAFPTGHPGLTLKAYRAVGSVGVFLRIHGENASERFEHLQARRDEVEALIGSPLEWSEQAGGAYYWIVHSRPADPEDEQDWARQFEFLIDALGAFERVVSLGVSAPTVPDP